MQFGTMQGVLGGPQKSVFEVAARLGFAGVELDWSERGQSFDCPAIRERAAQSGVRICSLAAHFLNDGNLCNADAAPSAAEVIRRGVELCSELGADVLLVPFFGRAEITDESEPALIEHLRVLSSYSQAAGVRLGVETARSGAQMQRVFAAVGSPFVGAYWDMANSLSLGYDNLAEIAALKGHLVQVHAKEWVGPHTGVRPMHYPGLNEKPLGEGDVPLAATLGALKAAGYDGWIVLETGAFGEPHASAARALATLRQSA